MRCLFNKISTAELGGGGRIQGSLYAINTTFRGCTAQVGGGIAIQSTDRYAGTGIFENCFFEACGRGNKGYNFGTLSAYGGSLGIMGGASCRCRSCSFTNNRDGAVSIVGSCSLIDCIFHHNNGSFGGLYVIDTDQSNEIILESCEFDDNLCSVMDVSKGNSIWICCPILFSARNCKFHSSISSSISFNISRSMSIKLESCCFKGDITHFYSKNSDLISIDNSGVICFSKSPAEALSRGFSFRNAN
jgi:hypothetical protein